MNYLFTVISNHNLSKTLGILPDKRTWTVFTAWSSNTRNQISFFVSNSPILRTTNHSSHSAHVLFPPIPTGTVLDTS